MVTLLDGNTVTLKPDDMYMRDDRGILTSIILGPASYGLVQPSTTRVAACVYAPAESAWSRWNVISMRSPPTCA